MQRLRRTHRGRAGVGSLVVGGEEHARKVGAGALQQGLMLGHHKVPVLVQEILCAVGHGTRIVLDGEAVGYALGDGEAGGALDLGRAIQLVGQVCMGGLRTRSVRHGHQTWLSADPLSCMSGITWVKARRYSRMHCSICSSSNHDMTAGMSSPSLLDMDMDMHMQMACQQLHAHTKMPIGSMC